MDKCLEIEKSIITTFRKQIWAKFGEESQKSSSLVSLSTISFKEIDNLDNLVGDLSKVLLRKIFAVFL